MDKNRSGSAENSRIPYRHPQPKEAFPELVIPHAIPQDERLWVPQQENVWFRPLCLSTSRGYWVNLLRVRKSGRAVAPPAPPARAWLRAERKLALSGA